MSTSVIASSASIGPETRHGEFCVIGENVTIGKGCMIGHHVTIHDDTQIGDHARIDDGSVIGKRSMKAVISVTTSDQELPPRTVGSNCIIGTNVVIYRGSEIAAKVLIADLSTVRDEAGDVWLAACAKYKKIDRARMKKMVK